MNIPQIPLKDRIGNYINTIVQYLNKNAQDKLISGETVKTINGQSVLGSGNMEIQSGGGTWGSITGELSNQTDLNNALNNRYTKEEADEIFIKKTPPIPPYPPVGRATVIHINESDDIKDPFDKVTCESGSFGKDSTPEENVFSWIRANTHAYVGVWNEDNEDGPVMELKQLSDDDFNHYADGSSAFNDITGASDTETLKHDVYIKLPKFWYISQAEENGWKIQVSDTAQQDWNEWDDTKLIGAYEAMCSDTGNNGNGIIRSISGVGSTGSVSQANFKTKSRNRNTGLTLPTGKGFQLITFDAHSIIGIIFYGYYGTLNSQAVCGSGTSTSGKFTGLGDSMGMTDTNVVDGNTSSIRFMGLDNWWGNKCEWIDNLGAEDGGVVNILKFNGELERRIGGAGTGACINKMNLGSHCDLMPKETASGGDYTVNYADYGFVHIYSGIVAYRSGSGASADGGVGCLRMDYGYTSAAVGSRLLFCGPIVLVS